MQDWVIVDELEYKINTVTYEELAAVERCTHNNHIRVIVLTPTEGNEYMLEIGHVSYAISKWVLGIEYVQYVTIQISDRYTDMQSLYSREKKTINFSPVCPKRKICIAADNQDLIELKGIPPTGEHQSNPFQEYPPNYSKIKQCRDVIRRMRHERICYAEHDMEIAGTNLTIRGPDIKELTRLIKEWEAYEQVLKTTPPDIYRREPDIPIKIQADAPSKDPIPFFKTEEEELEYKTALRKRQQIEMEKNREQNEKNERQWQQDKMWSLIFLFVILPILLIWFFTAFS